MTNGAAAGLAIGRRGLLKLGLGASVGAMVGTAAACGKDSATAGGSGQIKLRFCWWGAETRAKITQQAIEAYQKENPNVVISGEPADSNAYWDRLATQVAGGDYPDIIQMEEKYIRDYATRGALLDLAKYPVIDTSKWAPGTLAPGQFNGGTWGLNNGVNCSFVLVNPDVFKQANMELPDDKTWTWDDYANIAAEITAKTPDGTFGSNSCFFQDHAIVIWMRQRGKSEFTEHGLGFDPEDIQAWWDYHLAMMKSKALPAADSISEDDGKNIDQNSFATGKTAMSMAYTSNQANAFEKNTGANLVYLRFPSMTGSAKDAKMFYKAGQYFAGGAKSKHPDEAAKFLNFLVNTNTVGEILLTERGVPANLDVRKDIQPKLSSIDKKAVALLDAIESEIAPPPVTPPIGTSSFASTCQRYSEDVMFGRSTSADAAKKFVEEMKGSLS